MLYTDVNMCSTDEKYVSISDIDFEKLPHMELSPERALHMKSQNDLTKLKQYVDFQHSGQTAISIAQKSADIRKNISHISFETICQASNIQLPTDISLAQFIAIYHNLAHASRTHVHDYVELTYVLQGTVLMWINGSTQTLNAGDICVINASIPHIIAPQDEVHEIDFAFTIDFIKNCFCISSTSFEQLLPPCGFLVLQHPQNQRIEAMLHHLVDFYQRNLEATDNPTRLDISALSESINVFVALHALTHNIDEFDAPTRKISKLIHSQPRRATQQYIAQTLGYSVAHLARHIKKYAGMTFGKYIILQKLQYSTGLLVATPLSINQIAQKSGFKSLSYFHECFRNRYNSSPLQYRKNFTR